MTNLSFKQFNKLVEENDYDVLAPAKAVWDKVKGSYDAGKAEIDKRDKKKADDKAKAVENETKELTDDIHRYVGDLFNNFPYHSGAGGPEDLMDKFESYDSAVNAFKAFKALSETAKKFAGEVTSFARKGKTIKPSEMNTIEKKARVVVRSGKIPDQLVKFTKKEHVFFTKLFTVTDDFEIPEENTRQLFSKLKATANDRHGDAVQALLILFLYLADEFKAQAKYIGEIGKARKAEASKDPNAKDPKKK